MASLFDTLFTSRADRAAKRKAAPPKKKKKKMVKQKRKKLGDVGLGGTIRKIQARNKRLSNI